LGVKNDRLAAAVAKDSFLLIDTSVLIAYFNGGEEISEAAALLIDDWVQAGRNRACISAISAMELLVRPIRAKQPIEEYLDFFLRFSHVKCTPVDIGVAERAAVVRARYNARAPDALIIGTAIAVGADAIVTNDVTWAKMSPTPIVLLSDYV
jgi:predicted nucleic acid-binding protein